MSDKQISDSKEYVAFKLLEKIYAGDPTSDHPREYLLRLYCQCLTATSGHGIEAVLEQQPTN